MMNWKSVDGNGSYLFQIHLFLHCHITFDCCGRHSTTTNQIYVELSFEFNLVLDAVTVKLNHCYLFSYTTNQSTDIIVGKCTAVWIILFVVRLLSVVAAEMIVTLLFYRHRVLQNKLTILFMLAACKKQLKLKLEDTAATPTLSLFAICKCKQMKILVFSCTTCITVKLLELVSLSSRHSLGLHNFLGSYSCGILGMQ